LQLEQFNSLDSDRQFVPKYPHLLALLIGKYKGSHEEQVVRENP